MFFLIKTQPDQNVEKDKTYTRWFKYDWDYLYVNKSQFVPVIFEPPCSCSTQHLVYVFGLHCRINNQKLHTVIYQPLINVSLKAEY
jgi:hypothetical protein